MTGQPDPSKEWSACEPGLLTDQYHRLRRRQFLRLVLRTGCIAGGVAAAGFGGVLLYLRSLENNHPLRGLTCADVNELMPAYRNRTLDAHRSQLLEEHVSHCKICQPYRHELRAKPAKTRVS